MRFTSCFDDYFCIILLNQVRISTTSVISYCFSHDVDIAIVDGDTMIFEEVSKNRLLFTYNKQKGLTLTKRLSKAQSYIDKYTINQKYIKPICKIDSALLNLFN